MRLAPSAALLSLTLVLGGCGARHHTHVQVYGPQSRDWWYPGQTSPTTLAAADDLGSHAFRSPASNSLAVGDTLGMACFYDTVAYAARMRERRETEFAIVPDAAE